MNVSPIDLHVTHVNPHTKRKIQTLPLSGNYLITESDGRLRWAQPNESWRLYSNAGNQQILITNIRFDDTDHSPDLWLYSSLRADERDAINGRMLMEDNRIYLDSTRKWYVRQFCENSNRIGIKRFAGIPLTAWQAMWRRTIALKDIEIYGMTNNQVKMIYEGFEFGVYLKWPELQTDLRASAPVPTNGYSLRPSTGIVPWMKKNCNEGFVPFSDYGSMFPNEVDEFVYTIDIGAMLT